MEITNNVGLTVVTVEFYSSLDSAPLKVKRQPHEIETDRATARAAAP
jgi:hypothetical protein